MGVDVFLISGRGFGGFGGLQASRIMELSSVLEVLKSRGIQRVFLLTSCERDAQASPASGFTVERFHVLLDFFLLWSSLALGCHFAKRRPGDMSEMDRCWSTAGFQVAGSGLWSSLADIRGGGGRGVSVQLP